MFGSKDIATIEGQASTGFLRTSELVVRVQSKNPWELCYQGLCRVETMGIEPTTPCLQSRCSSQLSYVPFKRCPCYGYRGEDIAATCMRHPRLDTYRAG